jgi:hypothetical protein
MPLYQCAACGKTGWSAGGDCPWCGSLRLQPVGIHPPVAETGISTDAHPRRAHRRWHVIDAEARELPPPPGPRARPLEIVGIAILVVVFIVVVLIESGAIPLGSTPSRPPSVQELSGAGENWTISESTPHVVTFSVEGSLAVWANFTVHGGAVSIFLCNSTAVVHASNFPACNPEFQAAGGVYRASGVLFNMADISQLTLEIAFDNYGPISNSDTVVYLVWSTPLTVDSG